MAKEFKYKSIRVNETLDMIFWQFQFACFFMNLVNLDIIFSPIS
jgi:hypothetical protein